MHALEYLVAGLIMIIFISFSSAVIMPSVYIPVTHIKEQQLDILAERTTDKILLTPGIPHNWGIVEVPEATLFPIGDLGSPSWTIYPSSYSSAYEALSDDDDTTYIYTSSKNSIIELSIRDPEIGYDVANLTTINNLIVYVRGKGVGSIKISLGSDGYFEESSEIDFHKTIWTTEEFKSSRTWEWNEVENLKVKIVSLPDNNNKVDLYCSELFVYVNYTFKSGGLNIKSISGFGLALYEMETLSLSEPYTLDLEKLIRLTNMSIQLDSREVARSLGLMEGDHLKYGFSFTIKPAINIHQKLIKSETKNGPSTEIHLKIHVNVTNYEDIPLANANVYGIMLVFFVDPQNNIWWDQTMSLNVTDVSGKATVGLDYTIKNEKYALLYITYVDFYGLKSYVIDFSQEENVEPPVLIVPTQEGIFVLYSNGGASHMRGVFGIFLPQITAGEQLEMYPVWQRKKGAESPNVINRGGKPHNYYFFGKIMQDINILGIAFEQQGRFRLCVTSLSDIIGDELNYGTSPGLGGKKTMVVAKRLVKIEGMDYVFEFKMWRMAED